MSGAVSIAGADWLADENLQRLLTVLSADGEEARIAGGAVRNALIGEAVSDVDIATTLLPAETIRRGRTAGFKPVPTGIDHGTVTLIAGGRLYEVTTLRADVETDGRRAKVQFGRDWQADANRRDFTINGLYADADGTVLDLVSGLADIETRTLRFIGDPETRIREDYLRILRLFRFFAWYGKGRPDAAALKASARLKEGLDGLSAERVWSELRKLLSAPDPGRALLWMRQTGVLTRILPESEKWGIDAIGALIGTERDLGWTPDAMLRLEAIVPPDEVRMKTLGERLKMSKVEARRLSFWARAVAPTSLITQGNLGKMLYRGKPGGIIDRLKLGVVSARGRAITDLEALAEAGRYDRLLAFAQAWEAPSMPFKAEDLNTLGVGDGRRLGELLREVETSWVESGFTLDRDALAERAAALLAKAT